jgi:hypothetical protein
MQITQSIHHYASKEHIACMSRKEQPALDDQPEELEDCATLEKLSLEALLYRILVPRMRQTAEAESTLAS